MKGIAVFGAANVDIGGFPAAPLKKEDSNPGRVCFSMGGVGRNIACNVRRMGVPTSLVTALGGDHSASLIRADCAAVGVSLERAIAFPDAVTSTYLFIAEADGDLVWAVNDMSIHDRMTPRVVAPALDSLKDALMVLDANLPAETLTFLARESALPVVADAVSAAKAEKLRDALKHVTRFKPNRVEAERLTGVAIHDRASAERAVEALLALGAREVYCTLSTHGLCFGDASRVRFWPGLKIDMVNATGAGDAFTAALAWSLKRGLDIEESALAGLAAASIAVASKETVNPDMSERALFNRISAVRRELKL